MTPQEFVERRLKMYVGNNAREYYIPDNRSRGAASWRAGDAQEV